MLALRRRLHPPGRPRAAGRRRRRRPLPAARRLRRADQRDHRHLFEQARPARPTPPRTRRLPATAATTSCARGELYALVRCGDAGSAALGAHAHNDQLSFELCAGTSRWWSTPAPTSTRPTRRRATLFRSTALPRTLQIDGAEQNELRADYLFTLPDRSPAERLGPPEAPALRAATTAFPVPCTRAVWS